MWDQREAVGERARWRRPGPGGAVAVAGPACSGADGVLIVPCAVGTGAEWLGSERSRTMGQAAWAENREHPGALTVGDRLPIFQQGKLMIRLRPCGTSAGWVTVWAFP